MRGKRQSELVSGCAPDFGSLIFLGQNNGGSIRRERRRAQGSRMPGKRQSALASGCVPDFRSLVYGSRGDAGVPLLGNDKYSTVHDAT